MNRINRTLQSRSKLLATLVLLAISWSQFAFAEHQYSHDDVATLDDTCEVCLKFDRLDDVLATQGSLAYVSLARTDEKTDTLRSQFLFHASYFFSRAPPTR